jgi:hypothetical protein
MAESTAEAPDEGRAPQEVTQSDGWAKARTQHLLAVGGMAEGQCGYCGSYRADGLPPTLHHQAACPGMWP